MLVGSPTPDKSEERKPKNMSTENKNPVEVNFEAHGDFRRCASHHPAFVADFRGDLVAMKCIRKTLAGVLSIWFLLPDPR
jgi:homogentisate 1,2-dioxygenase